MFRQQPLARIRIRRTLPLLNQTALRNRPHAKITTTTRLTNLLIRLLSNVRPPFRNMTRTVNFTKHRTLNINRMFSRHTTIIVTSLRTVRSLRPHSTRRPTLQNLTLIASATRNIVNFENIATLTNFLRSNLNIAHNRTLQDVRNNAHNGHRRANTRT